MIAAHTAQLETWEQLAPADVIVRAVLPLPPHMLLPLQSFFWNRRAPAACAAAGDGVEAEQAPSVVKRWWLLVRVASPAWVPDELEERDELALSLAEKLEEDAEGAAVEAAEMWDLELPTV